MQRSWEIVTEDEKGELKSFDILEQRAKKQRLDRNKETGKVSARPS